MRDLTAKNYLTVWCLFNKFLIRLDEHPKTWENKVVLFIAYLIDKELQSQTVKSYVSVIRTTLTGDG